MTTASEILENKYGPILKKIPQFQEFGINQLDFNHSFSIHSRTISHLDLTLELAIIFMLQDEKVKKLVHRKVTNHFKLMFVMCWVATRYVIVFEA